MFEKVLVALDFSHYSQKILNRVSEIPGISEVVLLHVIDATSPSRLEWTPGPHLENANSLMAEKKEKLENLGLKVTINVDVIVNAVTRAPVSRAIIDVAEKENVSLIVIGARGINPIQELLLGSVSSFVLRHAATHVLVMHFPPAPDQAEVSLESCQQKLFSKVLVPTDFSPSAGTASELLKTIPGIEEIVILHVVTRAESPAEIEDSVQEAHIRLEDMKKKFMDAGVDVQLQVRAGDPATIILAVAAEENVSLIAMNAFGLGWLKEMVLGSTTFTVVRRAQKPVLVLRTGMENHPS
jgi:nucleotide-binding universal stress UspA family protein